MISKIVSNNEFIHLDSKLNVTIFIIQYYFERKTIVKTTYDYKYL